MEEQNSIFVKVTFELRAEWQENRRLDNIRGETIFQAEAIASTNVLGQGKDLALCRKCKRSNKASDEEERDVR